MEMDMATLIALCKSFRSMGDAVTDQLESFLDDSDVEDLNPNAVRMFMAFLEEVAHDTHQFKLSDEAQEYAELARERL